MNYNSWAFMLTIMSAIFGLSILGLVIEQAWTNIAIAIISALIIVILITIGTNKYMEKDEQ